MKRKKIYHFLGVLFLLSFFTTVSFAQGETCDNATDITGTAGPFTAPALTGTGASHADATEAAWYKLTITETGFLSINSCQGGTDTRLWVYSGTCSGLVPVADNDDSCPHATDGSGDSYASRIDNIIVSAGTYFIEWDSRWSANGFNFNVEFVALPEYDLTVVKDNMPYRMLPYSQIPDAGIDFEATIKNLSINEMTGIVTSLTVTDNGNLILTETSDTLASLASLTTDTVFITNGAPPNKSSFEVAIQVSANEPDENADNDIYNTTLSYRETYALEDGQTGYFGYGGTGGELTQGQAFSFNNDDTLHSVSYFIYGGAPADVISVEIFEMNGDDVGASIYSSGDISGLFPVAAPGEWWNHEFPNGLPVSGGSSYFFALHSNQTTGDYLGLGTNNRYFYPGNARYKVTDWTPLEGIVEATYLIRPNTENPTREVNISVDMTNEVISANGVQLFWVSSLDQDVPNILPLENMGDSIWGVHFETGVFDTVYYSFVNGDTEPLANLSACGIEIEDGVYSRFLAPGFEELTVDPVCFGSCGSCDLYEVTLTVDMNLQDVSAEGTFLFYTSDINEDPNPALMNDNGDGTWSYTLQVADGYPLYYLFSNGLSDSTTTTTVETGITSTCGFQIPDEDIYIRYLPNISQDTLLTSCFNTCGECITHDVTFTVDMTNEAAEWGLADTVFLVTIDLFAITNGEDEDEGVTLIPMTDNGDGTWSTTSNVLDGTDVYFVYSNGNPYETDEVEEVPEACAADLGDFDLLPLRYLTNVTESDTMATVCFSQCTECPPVNDDCNYATDLTSFLGQEMGSAQSTGTFTNVNAGTDENDPTEGIDCWYEESIERSVWFGFVGDGGTYHLETTNCDTLSEFLEDTQLALYTGDCDTLTAIACNDDIDISNDNYLSELNFTTTEGEVYMMMVDGYDGDQGAFCLSITQTPPPTSNVTFNVNMANETVGDTVFIAGSFNGWSDNAMTNNGDQTWSYTTALTIGDTIEYKFKNGHSGWEGNISGVCALGNNRYVVVDAADMDINLVCFNQCDDCTATSNVTFNVNMAHETVGDTVFIAGAFNGWSDDAMIDNGDETWSFTTTLTVGDTVEYKFKNGHSGWENTIPATCTLGGFGNRYVVVDASDMDVSIVCFNECNDCVVGINDPAFAQGFKIYPNPTKGITNIDFNFDTATDMTIKLTNNLGQTVRVESLNNVKTGSHQLNLTDLAKGIYNLQIMRGDEILNRQLIIE